MLESFLDQSRSSGTGSEDSSFCTPGEGDGDRDREGDKERTRSTQGSAPCLGAGESGLVGLRWEHVPKSLLFSCSGAINTDKH